MLALAIAAPWIAPYPYDEMQIMTRLKPPSLAHWFGTDDYGRDVLSRTLIGARLSLLMGLGATAFCLLVGVPIGLYAGYRRGRVEEAVMRTMDVLMSFPPILLGLLVLSVTPPALWKTILAVGVVYVPAIVRLTRAVTLELAQEEFVLAARARGDGPVLHPDARDPAQRVAADRRRRQPAHHVRHSSRRRAQLSRHGRAAAELRLGSDDQRGPRVRRPARRGSRWRRGSRCA